MKCLCGAESLLDIPACAECLIDLESTFNDQPEEQDEAEARAEREYRELNRGEL